MAAFDEVSAGIKIDFKETVMKKQLHYENLNSFPVIAAVRTSDAFEKALKSR